MTTYTTMNAGSRIAKMLPWLILLLVFMLFGMPIIMIMFGAFRDAAPGQPGSFTTAGFIQAFQNPRTLTAYGNSVMLGLVMGLIGVVIAAVLAFISVRSKTIFSKMITPLMVIVLAVPPLFFALSWDILGSPGIGLLNEWLEPLGLPSVDIKGAAGTMFVGGMKVASLVYFMLLGPFNAMDHRLEEAGRIAGSGWLGTFVRIILPSLGPAILGAFIIAFVVGLTAFDIPLIIGLPEGFNVFSTEIFSYLNETSPPNYASAGALAMVLIATVIAVVALRWWLLDRRSFNTVGGKSGGGLIVESTASKVAGAVIVILTALLTLVLPMAQMLMSSFQRVFGSNATLGLANYERILNDPTVGTMLSNTLFVSMLGGLLAVVIAFVLASLGRYGSALLRRSLDLMTWLPWAANGVLLGLGLVWLFLSVPFLRGLFGTVWILLIGLVVAATPLASRAIEGALAQISAELEEAGRISGATRLRVSLDIVVRLMIPAFISGWFICAVNIIGNLEVPILLSMPTNPTLSVTVYRLHGNGQTTQAAALFCLVLLIILIAGAVLWGLAWVIRKILNAPINVQNPYLGATDAAAGENTTKLIAQQPTSGSRRK